MNDSDVRGGPPVPAEAREPTRESTLPSKPPAANPATPTAAAPLPAAAALPGVNASTVAPPPAATPPLAAALPAVAPLPTAAALPTVAALPAVRGGSAGFQRISQTRKRLLASRFMYLILFAGYLLWASAMFCLTRSPSASEIQPSPDLPAASVVAECRPNFDWTLMPDAGATSGDGTSNSRMPGKKSACRPEATSHPAKTAANPPPVEPDRDQPNPSVPSESLHSRWGPINCGFEASTESGNQSTTAACYQRQKDRCVIATVGETDLALTGVSVEGTLFVLAPGTPPGARDPERLCTSVGVAGYPYSCTQSSAPVPAIDDSRDGKRRVLLDRSQTGDIFLRGAFKKLSFHGAKTGVLDIAEARFDESVDLTNSTTRDIEAAHTYFHGGLDAFGLHVGSLDLASSRIRCQLNMMDSTIDGILQLTNAVLLADTQDCGASVPWELTGASISGIEALDVRMSENAHEVRLVSASVRGLDIRTSPKPPYANAWEPNTRTPTWNLSGTRGLERLGLPLGISESPASDRADILITEGAVYSPQVRLEQGNHCVFQDDTNLKVRIATTRRASARQMEKLTTAAADTRTLREYARISEEQKQTELQLWYERRAVSYDISSFEIAAAGFGRWPWWCYLIGLALAYLFGIFVFYDFTVVPFSGRRYWFVLAVLLPGIINLSVSLKAKEEAYFWNSSSFASDEQHVRTWLFHALHLVGWAMCTLLFYSVASRFGR